MRYGLLFLTLITGCASSVHVEDKSLFGRPSKFNASASRYDGKMTYVAGYLNTRGHWWYFNIGDSLHPRDEGCLNLSNTEFLSQYRERFRDMRVVLRGAFHKDGWNDALHGCDNGNGIVIDEDYFKAHYGRFATTKLR
jgi:hypothetical protein